MSLNWLLQGLSFLHTVFAVVPHCFACFVAYQDANRYDFGLDANRCCYDSAKPSVECQMLHITQSFEQ